MLNINRILYATDFSSSSESALFHALYLARKHGAELHMLHAIVLHADDPHDPAHHFPDLDALDTRLREAAGDRMADMLAVHGASEDVVIQAQRRGIAAAPTIIEYAEDEDIDLIVMGTHGRRGLKRMLLGSVAEEVIRLAPCPVMVVRPAKHGSVHPFASVLVPVDFSVYSRVTVANAKRLADLYGAELILLHVLEENDLPALYSRSVPAEFAIEIPPAELVRLNIGLMLEEVVGRTLEAEMQVLVGDAVSVITQFARSRSVDLVVIASHGKGAIERLLTGSVAGGVISHAPCSMLVVKPFGKGLTSQPEVSAGGMYEIEASVERPAETDHELVGSTS